MIDQRQWQTCPTKLHQTEQSTNIGKLKSLQLFKSSLFSTLNTTTQSVYNLYIIHLQLPVCNIEMNDDDNGADDDYYYNSYRHHHRHHHYYYHNVCMTYTVFLLLLVKLLQLLLLFEYTGSWNLTGGLVSM